MTNPRYRILNLFFPFSDRQASESKRQRAKERKRGKGKISDAVDDLYNQRTVCNLFHESIETQPKNTKGGGG